MKNIQDLDIKGKKLLIRVDFNVPLDEHGNITDDIRIRGVLPTINHALDENARIIIISHMGRPKGQRVEKFSMAGTFPTAQRLRMVTGWLLTLGSSTPTRSPGVGPSRRRHSAASTLVPTSNRR